MSTLWFKQDDEFLLPKASINIRFRCPLAYHDPHHFNLTYMFIELLKDDLTEYTYDAELSGLYYGMATSKVGFTLTIRWVKISFKNVSFNKSCRAPVSFQRLQ